MILFRYLTREVLASLLLITSLLLFILMSNEFVHYLNQVAGGKFAAGVQVQHGPVPLQAHKRAASSVECGQI